MRDSPTSQVQPEIVTESIIYETLIPSAIELNCFICNSNYWTTFTSEDITSTSTSRILAFCDFFAWEAEDRAQLLQLASLTDPFCSLCSHKLSQLQDWSAQLEALRQALENLKSEIGELIVHSFPSSPNIQGTYNVKAKIVRACTCITPNENAAVVQDSDTHILSQDGNTSYCQLQTVELPNEFECNSFPPEEVAEHISYADEVEIWGENSTSPSIASSLPKGKSLETDSPKRKRQPPVRFQAVTKIEANSDGQCSLCPSTFKSQLQLSKHIRRKHSGVVHKCRYCEREFSDTSNRKRHEVSVHINMSRDYVCDSCGKTYRTSWMLRSHTRVAHEGLILSQYKKIDCQCHECGRVFHNLKNLRTHVRHNHTERNILCSTCGKPFKDFQRKRKHERTHFSAWELYEREGKTFHYKCQICPTDGDLGFRSKNALKDHYETTHPRSEWNHIKLETKPRKEKPRFFCPECPFLAGFSRKLSLDHHIASGHGKTSFGKYGRNCGVCGKPCRDAVKAKRHEDTHHPQLHVCHLCPETYARQREMKNHYVNVHPGVEMPVLRNYRRFRPKKYFCDKCDGHPGFSNKTGLAKHLALDHQDERAKKGKQWMQYNNNQKRRSTKPETDGGNENGSDAETEQGIKMADSDSDGCLWNSESRKKSLKSRAKSSSARRRVLERLRRRRETAGKSFVMEKEVRICLERVDSEWPKGKRLKRIKVKPQEENECETANYLLPDETAIKIEPLN